MFIVTKTYGHELGLSACFRQPRANSHCHDPHGYPLSFKLTFGAETLNENKWVIDFGGLKSIKAWLQENFDHRTILAADDPALEDFKALYAKHGFAPINVLPGVGCEAFAAYVFNHVEWFLIDHGHAPRVKLLEVEVREHPGNSAIFRA